MAYHDTQQVCTNGHQITDTYHRSPGFRQAYCDKCGAPTIISCQHCGAEIRGDYQVDGVIAIGFSTPVPSFCAACGKPYPWTATSLEAASELATEMESLTSEEREALIGTIPDLVVESPRTIVAETRFKRLMSKAGPAAAGAMRDLLVDIVSESVKKSLYGA